MRRDDRVMVIQSRTSGGEVLQPLAGFDEADLVAVVRTQYGESSDRLEFEPVGEDSWCYRLGELWVSLRRDLRGHFPAAYRAANLLWQEGNESVLAPLTGADGNVVRIVGGYPVVVFPHVVATPVAVPLAPGELARLLQ